MDALVAKAVERLGKKNLWLVVHAVQELDEANCTVTGVREALRQIRLYVDDDDFAAIAARFSGVAGDNFDVPAFVRAFLSTLPPRRQYAVGLVLRKVDPDGTGVVRLDALRGAYDVMRHPHVLMRHDPAELVDEFIAVFDAGRGDRDCITTDELAAYYVGISHTTPRDEDFELRCIRSFSLDRPRPRLDEEDPNVALSEMRRGGKTPIHSMKKHPLYETTSMGYGKDCENVKYDGKFSLNHCFTKHAPLQPSGGATSMNM